MKTYAAIGMVILALAQAGGPAYAQEKVLMGTIKDLDLRPGRSLTLDDGVGLSLPDNLKRMKFASYQQIGHHVKVTYDDDGGRNVVQPIDQEVGGIA